MRKRNLLIIALLLIAIFGASLLQLVILAR